MKVIASTEESPYISSKKKSLRLQQAQALYERLPEAEKQGALQSQKVLEAVESVAVDRVVDEGKYCIAGVALKSLPLLGIYRGIFLFMSKERKPW